MKTAAAILPFKPAPVPFPLAGAHTERCPRCRRGTLVRIEATGRVNPFDWVRCHRCQQIISTRSTSDPGPQAA